MIRFYLFQSDVWLAFGQVCEVLSVHIFWIHEKVLMGQPRLGREKDNFQIQHLFHWDIVLSSYKKQRQIRKNVEMSCICLLSMSKQNFKLGYLGSKDPLCQLGHVWFSGGRSKVSFKKQKN